MSKRHNELLGRMTSKEYTQKTLSEKINVSVPTMCNKMKGNVDFKASEIKKLCEVLDIDTGEIGKYFF